MLEPNKPLLKNGSMLLYILCVQSAMMMLVFFKINANCLMVSFSWDDINHCFGREIRTECEHWKKWDVNHLKSCSWGLKEREREKRVQYLSVWCRLLNKKRNVVVVAVGGGLETSRLSEREKEDWWGQFIVLCVGMVEFLHANSEEIKI